MAKAGGGGSRSRGGRPPSDATAPSERPKTHPMRNLASHRKFLAIFATFYAAERPRGNGLIPLTWENAEKALAFGANRDSRLRKP